MSIWAFWWRDCTIQWVQEYAPFTRATKVIMHDRFPRLKHLKKTLLTKNNKPLRLRRVTLSNEQIFDFVSENDSDQIEIGILDHVYMPSLLTTIEKIRIGNIYYLKCKFPTQYPGRRHIPAVQQRTCKYLSD